mgnify:CR=1 FL=1
MYPKLSLYIDGQFIGAEGRREQDVYNPATGKVVEIDFGFVGEPVKVNTEILETIMKSDAIPVIAPVGVGVNG